MQQKTNSVLILRTFTVGGAILLVLSIILEFAGVRLSTNNGDGLLNRLMFLGFVASLFGSLALLVINRRQKDPTSKSIARVGFIAVIFAVLIFAWFIYTISQWNSL